MKKSKVFKRASLIALSAVLTAGIVLGATGCGGGGGGGSSTGVNDRGYRNGTPGRGTDPNKLTVYIFCNESDTATNRQVCNEWMAAYNKAHNTSYSVDFVSNTNKTDYFDTLVQYWSGNNMYDVIYLAPRFVRSYAEKGNVVDITEYVDKVSADPALTDPTEIAEANATAFGQVWKNAASYYAYAKGTTGTDAYTMGQAVSYDAASKTFKTDADGTEVGIYGLPKDYSNFSTGYNRLFFSDEMKEAVTTTKPVSSRNGDNASVKGAKNETSGSVSADRVYTIASGRKGTSPIVQYAASGSYTNPYTNETVEVTDGQEANLINIGVPTRYYPFNFFRFNSYTEALAGGDPMAVMCEAYTEGKGYVVTIPGFPDETFKLPESVKTDANAPYDTTIGHIVYTYAEYSALLWAMTYFLNTYDVQPFPGGEKDGYGGTFISGTEHYVIFGGEQYEGINGAAGSVLYLLPWLAGNDADLIDATSQYCTSMLDGKVVPSTPAVSDPANWRDYAGDDTNIVSKMTLDGTTRDAAVQYGFDSERFVETYGAFLALASDWNGNNGGDSNTASSNNGWAYFRGGRSLVYGAGSWDAATRNDSAPDVLDFGQMATPVSEKYALYSTVKGANYTMETYSNGATAKGVGNDANNDNVQRTNLADGLKVYNADEIALNQALRQDKWAARMDSVGYAVNGQVTNYTGAHAWKEEAAVSLAMALTISRDAQITLTYAGAQFPNFRDQMEDFVYYQDKGADGAFSEMLTPEGFSDMHYYKADGSVDPAVAETAAKIWDGYYDIALEMQTLARNKDTRTVGEYLKTKNVEGAAIRYDTAFENTTFNSFVAGSDSTAFLAYSMKILRMVTLRKADREINLRMQYGLNAVRDSTMYTFSDSWLGAVDARDAADTMFAYAAQIPFDGTADNRSPKYDSTSLQAFIEMVKRDPSKTGATWQTPFVYTLSRASEAQRRLNDSMASESK